MFDFRRNHFLQALFIFALGWLIVTLSQIIIIFFIALIIILLLHPLVSTLKRHHFPTALAVLTPVLIFLGILALIGFFVLPNFISQSIEFAEKVPAYLHDLRHYSIFNNSHFSLDSSSITHFLQGHSSSLSHTVISFTTRIVDIVVGVLTIIIVTVYGVASYDRIRGTLLSYVPHRNRDRAHDIWSRVEKKIITWVGAQLMLSAAVGIMVWIGSWLLGLPFPAILGLIAFFLEIIPTIGPIVATLPGFLLGLTISLKIALFAIVMHIVVAQIEAHVLAPWLLGRTVKLHPIIIIFSLLAGALLQGILGIFVAVPAALVISAFVDSFRDGKPQRYVPAVD